MPIAEPPQDNTAGYLNIGGDNQAKQGPLRIGTSDDAPPFEYQLEVLGEGAQISNVTAENNFQVGKTTETLFVDGDNGRVCIGPCLGIDGSRLEVSGGGTLMDGGAATGLFAESVNSKAIYGIGSTYGIYGIASGADNYGIWGVNPLGVAVEGRHTGYPATISSIGAFSNTGYGIYGTNINPVGLWAGYFGGRVESSKDVTGAKYIGSQHNNSLVPYTSAQLLATYDYSALDLKILHHDGTNLWVQNNTELWKVRASDGFKVTTYIVGAATTDLVDTGSAQWITTANDTVQRINPSGGTECSLDLSTVSVTNPVGIVFAGQNVLHDTNVEQNFWVIAEDASGAGVAVKIRYDVDGDTCEISGNPISIAASTVTLESILYNGTYLVVLGTDTSTNGGIVIYLNPMSGDAVNWTNWIGTSPRDMFFDNHFYWISSADDSTIARYYEPGNKVCATTHPDTLQLVSCSVDTDCDNVDTHDLGGCFPYLQEYGTYDISDATHTNDAPSYLVFDGVYVWFTNAWDLGSSTTYFELVRMNASDPTQLTRYAVDYEPIGLTFDGTNLWVSTRYNGLQKVYSGTGYGLTDLSQTLTLQQNSSLVQQEGSINITGSGRIGVDVTAAGELTANNNVWGAQEAGDTFFNYSDTWTNTGNLAAAAGVYSVLSLIETSDGTTFYIGTYGGDVYKSIDNGVNWTATGELTDATNVYALLEDTIGADAGAIYAGTSSYDGDTYWGEVFKSTDGGTNWTATGELTDATNVYALLEDTIGADAGAIYAGTGYNGDVFKSTDGGTNWTATGELTDVIYGDARYVNSLLESSDGTLYAGVYGGDYTADVFKSTNGGQDWSSTKGEGYHQTDLSWADYVYSLIETSDGMAIYAATGPFGQVFRTIDQGGTWEEVLDFGSGDFKAIAETSDGTLYAGTIYYGGVYKSTDGGDSWSSTSELTGVREVNALIGASDGAVYAGTSFRSGIFKTTTQGDTWDSVNHLGDLGDTVDVRVVFSLLEDSDGMFYAGTSTGDVFKSTNKGTSWINTDCLIGATSVSSLLEASDGVLYAGVSNVGEVYKSTNGGTNWTNTGDLAGALGVYSLIESSDGITLYAGTQYGGGVFKSTDQGVNWQATGGPPGQALLETSDGTTLYAGSSGNNIEKSTDGGNSWDPVGSFGAYDLDTLVEDNNGYIYAAVSEANVLYKSVDGGDSWNPTNTLPGASTAAYQFALIKGSSEALYVGISGANVFESTDEGDSWTALGNPTLETALGVTTTFVYSLIEASDGTLYAGTRPNGDVAKLELGVLASGTYTCPAGHFVKNVETDSDGKVTGIECRAL